MARPEPAALIWTKSTRSGNGGDCVEVAREREVVFVRDSKDAAGAVLAFPCAAWRAFVQDLKIASAGC